MQTDLFGDTKTAQVKGAQERWPTFQNNMKLPIHRWYRYSAGYSAEWVAEELHELTRDKIVLDPFAGSGTTLIKSQELGFHSIGLEAHPFVHTIASGKLLWTLDPVKCQEAASNVIQMAKEINHSSSISLTRLPPLLERCYSKENLQSLLSLKKACRSEENSKIQVWLNLALTSILRITSTAGTAPWQYVLPNRSKAKVAEAFTAFLNQTEMMCADMRHQQHRVKEPIPVLLHECDARNMLPIKDNQIDVVLTSPPYANNYDYADATRLEVTFWHDRNWKEEQQIVKESLMRSCSQHSANLKTKAEEMIGASILRPIQSELRKRFNELGTVKQTKGGKKNYDLMAVGYFHDMACILHELRRVCNQDATMALVVGDSAPYGVHLPVDQWLGEIAVEAGFKEFTFEKLRDRNTKWKNRKHRVLLHEGILRIK